MFSTCILVLFFDLVFGEPPNILHPTVWMGKMISSLEKAVYIKDGIAARISGSVLVAFVLFFACVFGIFAQSGFEKILPGPWSQVLIAITASMTIGFRSLFLHARPILRSLTSFRTVKARKALSLIVGRDTEKLNRSQISCATVETLAENLGDSIIAPLFFFAIFGLPGAFMYRAANTMDSMLGYKNERYKDFGWAAAHVDDIFNFVPCRVCALPCLIVASAFWGRALACLKTALKYNGLHDSPNAGWYEAAAAGALDARLGGTNYYKGEKLEFPHLNPEGKSCHPRHIIKVSRLVAFAAVLAALQLDAIIFLSKIFMKYNGG